MALPPKPVIVPQVCPEIARYTRGSLRVQREMMRIFMRERCVTSILQPQVDLVERAPGRLTRARPRPHRRTPGPVSINVVTKRVRHEKVDRFRRQKLIRDLRVSLLPQIGAFRDANIEKDATDCVLAGRLFLIVLEQ